MGYRINYAPVGKLQHANSKSSVASLIVFFFLLFCAFTCFFWPQGRMILLDFLVPGDYAVTVSATDSLLTALSNGESIQYALTTFCMDIFEGANLAAH